MASPIRIHKYLPLAILYFFFNGFLLPSGLLYTTILTPVFILWLYRYPSFHYISLFFLVSFPFLVVHFIQGVDILVYLKSWLLMFSVFVFCLAFFQFLLVCGSLGYLFKQLAIINILMVCLAILLFFIVPLRGLVWYSNIITIGSGEVYRLKLFTYEASYYSLLLIPIAFYYYLKMMNPSFPNKRFIFLIITLPLLLSFSFGVLAGLLLALVLLFLSDLRLLSLHPRMSYYLLIAILILLSLSFIMIQFFPDNIIFTRIANIFKGRDTSMSGRTFDSIYLGWKLAAEKSIFFGAGSGQIKVNGLALFNEYYVNRYSPEQLVIPNSMGDILAQYGLLGVLLKLGAEIWLFFKTRVYQNLYRLGLFLFVFLYQFTGSFVTNIAEYVIWILAFSPLLFPEFNRNKLFVSSKQPELFAELPETQRRLI